MKRSTDLFVLFTACVACLGASTAEALTLVWTNGGTGAWNDPGNWGGTAPGSGDAGQINNGGTGTIDSSMTIASFGVTLGTATGGSGNLQITGGSLSSVGDVRIGGNGTNGVGVLTMSGGSIAITGGANLNLGFGPAASSTANGTIDLSDGSILVQSTNGIIAVGNRGTGTVNQTGGSVFARSTGATPASLISIGRSSSSPVAANGTYNLSGGSLTAVTVAFGSAVFAGANNTFALSGTGVLTVGTLSIINTSATNNFNFTGGTLAVTNVNMSLTNNGGTLKPGGLDFTQTAPEAVPSDPTGTMTFGTNANYTQNSGTLAIDIDGPGSNDVVSMGAGTSVGTAVLSGNIAVNLIGGYDPPLGTTFDIVMADTIANSATVTGLTASGNRFAASKVTGGDGREVLRLTVTIAEPDNDNDQMGDAWELAHGLDPTVNDAALDPDGDGLTNLQEYRLQTDPQDPDTDHDGLSDGVETHTGIWVNATDTGTNPLLPDSDHDGLPDGLENPDRPYTGATQPGTNPNIADTDGDLFSDGEEIAAGSNPKDPASLPNPAAGSTLAVDFETAVTATQPGFVSMNPALATVASPVTWVGSFGPLTVTLSPLGTCTIDSRDRAGTGGGGGYNPLFRDFVFANLSDNDGDGLEIAITGLAPLKAYPVTLWSYDSSSLTPARHSTWSASDGDNLITVKVPLYVIDNTLPGPSGLNDERMKFDAVSDSSGTLIIRGLKEDGYVSTPPTHNVFLNGFLIGPPVTPITFTQLGPLNPAGTSFPLTWTSDDIATYRVERSANLVDWTTLNSNVDGQAGTTTFTDGTISAASSDRHFYRVSRLSP